VKFTAMTWLPRELPRIAPGKRDRLTSSALFEVAAKLGSMGSRLIAVRCQTRTISRVFVIRAWEILDEDGYPWRD
jgi:hypothetical protein